MVDRDILATGTELSELTYSSFWDWFIQFSDIQTLWRNSPTYILAQAAYILGGIATLAHALIRGGRLPYLWLTIVLHGVVVESITYIHPDVDNFWHSQTPIIFLGRRLPLHIILLYPCFIYQASVAAAKLKLPKWSEPFAVGLLTVLIDIPYDIVSVRYIHWTWHDTDPNIEDRHYWVPWTSYFFHATFAAALLFWFHFLREKLCPTEGKWVADKSVLRELWCSLLTAVLGSPTGLIPFILIYHPLHDVYKIHTEIAVFIIVAVFLVLAWTGDRDTSRNVNGTVFKLHWSSLLLMFHLLVHYALFLLMPVLFNPEDEVSTGLKEPIGPCNEYVPLRTIAGITLRKRKYLCSTDYDEKYFDFSCLKRVPSEGSIWYSICGVKFENRAEYVVIIGLIAFVAISVFSNLHLKSYGDAVFDDRTALKANGKSTTKKKRN
ncbi:unnamed protein product [Phyllotreta striolata]|uniref:DUF7802 domain-containing protein n=1 Tax=Phyllotreta striolata TaxID=444603 RepID=A0A9N9TMS2_PHYSR|nr:unnamed protein product [Phyllotreta striolata]